MEDYPLWANIDVIVEAHASGTGAEPPHSYAFTRCITKKVLRRTYDHVLELINNGTIARGTLLVTMVRVVLIILGVRPPTEPWADADACADSRSSRAHTQRVCARVPLFRALVPLAGALLAMSLPFDYRVAAFEQITNFTNGTREPFRASPSARALPREPSPARRHAARAAKGPLARVRGSVRAWPHAAAARLPADACRDLGYHRRHPTHHRAARRSISGSPAALAAAGSEPHGSHAPRAPLDAIPVRLPF